MRGRKESWSKSREVPRLASLARDDHSFGELIGLGEGGVVDDFGGIKDGDIGKEAGLEEAAVLKMLALGGQGSDFADGGFEREQMRVADIMAEEARHGAEGARMRVRLVSGAVEGHGIGVEADAGPGL